MSPQRSLKTCSRLGGELDRIEQESFDFNRTRYLELAAQDKSIHTIDATPAAGGQAGCNPALP